jgi:hypothetical protein
VPAVCPVPGLIAFGVLGEASSVGVGPEGEAGGGSLSLLKKRSRMEVQSDVGSDVQPGGRVFISLPRWTVKDYHSRSRCHVGMGTFGGGGRVLDG